MAIDRSRTALPQRAVMRWTHALLVVLLLLATTGTILHPYALDEHRDGHVCGACLAASHGGAPLSPETGELALPRVATPTTPAASRLFTTRVTSLYRARAPPV